MHHRSLSSHLIGFAFALALITTGCVQPISPLPISPLSTPPLSTAIDEKVDVGGYKLQILCTADQGIPSVIVDAGFGEPPIESGTWSQVVEAVKDTTRICLYDRAGLGASDSASSPSRTSQDNVDDLRGLLINAGVSAPYILVGHSIAGFNVRLYASQYPNEVVGMVLVDASHPDVFAETLAALPPASSDEPESLTALRTALEDDSSSNPENFDFTASAAQVRDAKSREDLPLVVLTRSPTAPGDPNLPPKVSASIAQIWQELQTDLVGLSANSTHIIATEAGHYIQVHEPQLVIDAILKVLDEAGK